MTPLHFQPIFGSYPLVVAAALVLMAPFALAPTYRSVSRTRRAMLVGLRGLVVCLVILAMLRPTWVLSQTKRQTATLILLIDQSRSMQVPDAADGQKRWQALTNAVMDAVPKLHDLADELEIKVYTFDAKARILEWDGRDIQLPETADGPQSDIGSVLADVVRRELGKRLAGVILLSDGAARAYSPRVELHEAARELSRLGYPLFTITFGLPRDKSQARDVAVEDLQDHYSVYVKTELQVQASLRVQGFVNKQFPVELVVEDPEGSVETVGPIHLQATRDGEQLDINMTYVPQVAGQYKLTVKADEQPGELVTKNNQLTAFLTVREGGLRVAYLWGESTFEPKFVRRAIDQSPDMQLDSVHVPHGHRDDWPLDWTDILQAQDYDVYILHSVHAAALGEDYLAELAEAVEGGVGLIMVGGTFSFGPGGYYKSPLAAVLPVKMDRLERQDFDSPVSGDLHLSNRKMVPVDRQFILHLAPGRENEAVWNSLPALDYINRFRGIKPRAMVLARSDEDEPVLVAGEYGSGRVLAFAGDSTWRWCMHGRQAQQKRFWRQVVLWLARRDQVEKDHVWIRLAQRRFHPMARVQFTTGATSSEGDPVEGATFRAELVSPVGSRRSLRLSADGDVYSGWLKTDTKPDEYSVEVTASRGTRQLGTAVESFVVYDQDLELHEPAANPSLMANLAGMTAKAGGRVVAPEELGSLLDQIEEKLVELDIEVQTSFQFADEGRHAWAFFLCVAALLSTEWVLRKKWGLV